ncbi:MAG: MT-A70 family methyltransferase [Spirochaetia bacterium]|jgi:N6-adenosine-specific RNA methylase IME4
MLSLVPPTGFPRQSRKGSLYFSGFRTGKSIPKTAHSEKPKEYYKLIKTLYPGRRYLELFARGEKRKGWTSWGDEV